MTVARRFETQYRVRFDEADAGGHLRPSGYLRYAQDIAWQHSEAAGFAREWYAERALHWLVRDVDLHILGPVTFGDQLAVTTEVIGWRHVWARRHAEVRRVLDAGEPDLVAIVETDWVLLGQGGRPARLPPEMAAFLSPGGAFARRRIDLEAVPDSAEVRTVRVRPADVDPMGHLNNAAYLDLIDEAMAGLTSAAGSCPHYQVSYLLPAVAGSRVEVSCWQTARGAIDCRLSDAADRTELTRAVIAPAGR